MPSTSELKSRMVSITETKKVTDALYMISSVKMRRAKREHQNSEKYYDALAAQISELLCYIGESKSRYFHTELLQGKEHRRRGIILVSSDKGLAGSYNQTAIKMTEEYMSRHPETVLFIIGEYARQYFKSKKIPFITDFHYSAAFPTILESEKICIELLSYFNDDILDEISMIYTDYMGAKPSVCKTKVLLPLDRSAFFQKGKADIKSFKEFFPNADTVLKNIVSSYLTGIIYSSLVDSYCSEQQARMLAMSTASKNAEDMLKKLKTQYNALRQAGITNEMIEITSGANALKSKQSVTEALKNE